MAEKKGQHLVPVCYLKSFLADIADKKKQNPRLEAGVYVNSKFLDSGWKMKGVNNKVFKESYYYNLPEDDRSQPYIENYLSRIEGLYLNHLQKIKEKSFDNDDMSFLSYFTTLQHIRVDKFISKNQLVWDRVADSYDQFSGETKYKKVFEDIVKRQIPTIDLGWIPHPHARIIYNNTHFPFVTSDNPVVRKEVNVTDLSKVIPKSAINHTVSESHESLFIFFPLTPSIAYVSCDLMIADKKIEFSDFELVNIFHLNCWSIFNAHKHIYSSIVEPIKGEAELSQYLKTRHDGKYIKIYTENYRLILKGNMLQRGTNSLSFVCASSNELHKLKLGEKVSLVEVIDKGSSISGMRGCSLLDLDVNSGLVVFESNSKLS